MRYLRKIITTMLLLVSAIAAQAQQELYIYQHGSLNPDTLPLSKVSDISHSRYDLENVRHDDYVLMSVTMSDSSVRRFLLAELDSVVMQRDGVRIPLVCFTGGMTTDGTGTVRKGPRRTSLDGDFTASASEVDFFWETGDKIYVEAGEQWRLPDSVSISDTRRTADFFFKSGNITGDNVKVYYVGQTPEDYNVVVVANEQSQQTPNNTAHIGNAGDCGVAVATKRQNAEGYSFMLEHKSAYLCFMPYIANDLGRTVLKKITVRSDSAIAGKFTLSPDGIKPKSDTTHVITLTTGGNDGFVLPQRATQNTSAYMVIAPQNGSTRLTCEFTVYDTALQSEGVFTKMVDLTKVEPNMVYVVTANCNNYVVDLGLPVKFLNHNMGAFAPEEYGGYYAYGEIEDKGNYTSGNYTNQNTPSADIANIRLTDKDVAHMRLGGNFSIPTSAEFNMLVDSCTWTWQGSFNGKPGYKITGKNGNTLFMPAAGYRNGTSNNELNSRGLYRTSQLIASGEKKNWYLNFYSNSRSVPQSGDDIWLGESIRPVVSSGVTMTDGTLVQVMTDSVQWLPASPKTATLFGTVYGISKAKTPVEIGFVAGAKDTITIATGIILKSATTTTNGKYLANFAMPKDTCYYIRAYAKDQDGNIEYGNVLQFGRAYVDLGLSVKWANMNIGAVRPEQDGGYYAWGETATKATYTESSNRWYENSTWLMPDDGQRDDQATRNDVAAKNWKGVWMLPNDAELVELKDNCTFTLSTLNGVRGYVIKSNINQNSIFMPISGYYNKGDMTSYQSKSYFQSSQMQSARSDYSKHLEENKSWTDWFRYHGISARAVWKTNATAADGKTPMYVRTLPAQKNYDGTTETNTLRGIIRGVENAGDGTSYGFKYWEDGHVEDAQFVANLTPDADGYISYLLEDLTAGKTYHFAAYINNGTDKQLGQVFDITTVTLIDLGLSVKWANVNIGAESEGAGGDFYRWGATTYYRNTTQEYKVDKNITPQSGHDIVSNRWGSAYRMPTMEEYQELIDSTTQTWTTRNGYSGVLFTSKRKGFEDRSIFMSGDGYWNGSYLQHDGWSDYWTSTVSTVANAYGFGFNDSKVGLGDNTKAYGFMIRGVQDNLAYLQTLNIGRNVKNGTEIDTLKAYINVPSGASLTVGFDLSENPDMSDSTHYAVGTMSDGTFQKVVPDVLQKGKTYYYRAFATNDNTTYRYGKVLHFVLFDFVDLGLPSHKLWTNVNIGANSPEDFGDYIAWGETQPKEDYSTATYQYNGVEIGSDIAGTQYDAAMANWGSLYQLPLPSEYRELINNTNKSLVTVNGVQCYKFVNTSDASKFILLPRAGRMSGKSVIDVNCGLYLSSRRYSLTECNDIYLHDAGSYEASDGNRNSKYLGYSVRALMIPQDSVAEGVYAKVKTEGIDWQWSNDGTSATVTLKGSATLSATIASSWGFVVGNMQDVEAATPAGANMIMVATKNADNVFEYTFPLFDGSKKFFRAFLKVGDKYYMGDIKTITAADLLAADFRSDGTAFNGAFTPFTTATKNGTANVAFNEDYQRYEANFSANTFSNRPNYWYSFNYNDGITFGDFQNRLSDGHTLEVLMKVPEAVTSNGESNALASYETGGSGIGVRNKEIFTQFYTGSDYHEARAGEMQGWDKYYHVVAVWDKDAGKLRLYVDGYQVKEVTASGNFRLPDSNSRYYMIGAEPSGSNAYSSWSGIVVYARIYDAPLTSNQVGTLYNWK